MILKASMVVSWVLTVLDALVLGIPGAVLIGEAIRDGRLSRSWTFPVLYVFVAAWLMLLLVWLATGHLNPRRARVAWYCLLASLAAMTLVMSRPELQSA